MLAVLESPSKRRWILFYDYSGNLAAYCRCQKMEWALELWEGDVDYWWFYGSIYI